MEGEMNKNKITWIVSTGMIISAILIFLALLPYIMIFNAYRQPDKSSEIAQLKKAYTYSVFNYQKVYVAESLLTDLIIVQDYNTAIEYIDDLEKSKAKISDNINYFAAYAYRESQDYDKALSYAKQANRKQMLISLYIKKQDFENAEKLMEEYSKESQSYKNYHLDKDRAEIEYLKGNYINAEEYINKTLNTKRNLIEVYKLKSKISKSLGKTTEAKAYEEKAKEIEAKLYKGF